VRRLPVVVAALLLVLGFASASFLAIRQPLSLGDYLAIWGLKARAIHASGELSSVFRVDPEGDFSHPAYPPLWPLLLAGTASLIGRYDELGLSLLRPMLLGLAAALTFARTRGATAGRLLAAAALTLLPYFQTAAYAGYAEALLLVLVLAALLLLENPVPAPFTTVAAGVLLALAALTKQEGTVAVVVVAGFLLAARRMREALLVGTIGLGLGVLPWSLYRAGHSVRASAVYAVSEFDPEKPLLALSALASAAGWTALPWLIGAVTLLALAPEVRRERRALLAGVATYAALILASFAFASVDVAWHVRWSWDRLALLPVAAGLPALLEAAAEPFGTREE
jgi:hypothetical protein